MEYFAQQQLKEKRKGMLCEHPHLEKLYYVGAFLITYACTSCGEEFTIAMKMEMDEKRRQKIT